MKNHFNCIYMYINKVNKLKYIGKANDFNRRHKQHINSSKNISAIDYNLPIHKAISKYGETNFEIKILAENICNEKIDEYEKFFIKRYNTLCHKNGYNIANGGQGGNTFIGKTDEEMKIIRKKISESNKKPKSKEHTEKNSESHKGLQIREKNGMAKKVKAIDEFGNIKIFNCSLDASDFLNVKSRTLQYYLTGKSKTNFYK